MIDAINSLFHAEVAIQVAIERVARRRTMPKGTVLVRAGQISNDVHFIEQGLIRSFYYDNKREITSWMANEGLVIWPLASYLLGQPTRENLQLLEKTTLITVSRDELNRTCLTIDTLQCQIMKRYLLLCDQRIQILLIAKAEERLEAFKQANPVFYDRVPLRYIATYLGIDPATLSRIRGRFRKQGVGCIN